MVLSQSMISKHTSKCFCHRNFQLLNLFKSAINSKFIYYFFFFFRPEWVQPISVTLQGGETVYSTPPPGSGAILTYILSILDGYNISAMNSDSFEKETLTIHRMVEAFKFAFARRTELADPNFINMTEVKCFDLFIL